MAALFNILGHDAINCRDSATRVGVNVTEAITDGVACVSQSLFCVCIFFGLWAVRVPTFDILLVLEEENTSWCRVECFGGFVFAIMLKGL